MIPSDYLIKQALSTSPLADETEEEFVDSIIEDAKHVGSTKDKIISGLGYGALGGGSGALIGSAFKRPGIGGLAGAALGGLGGTAYASSNFKKQLHLEPLREILRKEIIPLSRTSGFKGGHRSYGYDSEGNFTSHWQGPEDIVEYKYKRPSNKSVEAVRRALESMKADKDVYRGLE
jgi:hypothetical protein